MGSSAHEPSRPTWQPLSRPEETIKNIIPHGPSPWAIWINLVAVYVAWGSTYLAIRFAIETMPPFFMSGARFLFAGAVLYGWRRASGDMPPSRQEWRSATIIGSFLLIGGNGGVVWAEQWIASGLAALLVTTVPLWMVLMDMLRPDGRWPGWLAITGILIGFAGVAVLMGPSHAIGNGVSLYPIGVVVLILASLFWSIGSLYSRKARLPSSPLLGTGMEMLAGGAGLLVLGGLTGEWQRLDPSAISARSLWGLAYLIVFGSWIGFAAYTWLLRVAPTPLVSTYAYVNPVVAILLGHLLAEEPLTPRILMATAIIIGSVALTTMNHPALQSSKAAQPKSVALKDD
jgi:drug/metabolite transporter (DMT)-like permease